jgi:hypothetical protein
MTTPVTAVADGPAVPDSSVATATFDAQYEAFNTWEKDTLRPGMNALAAATYTNAVEAEADATAAAGSASAAAASALAAGAILWVSGTTYAIGDSRVAPLDLANVYVRRTAGAGTTDPSADPTNWLKRQVGAGLVLLATLTPTAAANVDFLTAFSATYSNYLIVGEGLRPSADDQLRMRYAVAGAADSSSSYFSSATGGSVAATTQLSVTSTVTTAGKGCGFTVQVQNANDATNAKTGSVASMGQSSATPNFTGTTVSHGYNAANAITGFRLYWNSGANFAAVGVVRVYGYANT